MQEDYPTISHYNVAFDNAGEMFAQAEYQHPEQYAGHGYTTDQLEKKFKFQSFSGFSTNISTLFWLFDQCFDFFAFARSMSSSLPPSAEPSSEMTDEQPSKRQRQA